MTSRHHYCLGALITEYTCQNTTQQKANPVIFLVGRGQLSNIWKSVRHRTPNCSRSVTSYRQARRAGQTKRTPAHSFPRAQPATQRNTGLPTFYLKAYIPFLLGSYLELPASDLMAKKGQTSVTPLVKAVSDGRMRKRNQLLNSKQQNKGECETQFQACDMAIHHCSATDRVQSQPHRF